MRRHLAIGFAGVLPAIYQLRVCHAEGSCGVDTAWWGRWQPNSKKRPWGKEPGFHLKAVNWVLQEYAEKLDTRPRSGPLKILVPLCGKTVDMPWLLDNLPAPVEVVGVEAVPQALYMLHTSVTTTTKLTGSSKYYST